MSKGKGADSLMDEQAKRFLRAHPAAGRNVAAMVRLLGRCTHRSFKPKQRICMEGEPARELYILLHGKVAVFHKDKTGKQRRLGRMEKPRVFGHMAVVDGSRRSASCVAQTEVTVAALSAADTHKLLVSSTRSGTQLRRLLLASMAQQLTQSTQQLERAMDKAEARRLAGDDDELVDLITGTLGGWTDQEMDELRRVKVG